MTGSHNIGQRIALKYTIFALLLILLGFFLIPIVLFYTMDWPLNIGGENINVGIIILKLLAVIGIGITMAIYTGKWAGMRILKDNKSHYINSLISLGSTIICMLIPTLNILVIITGLIISMILAIFMGNELKTKHSTL